jgi:tellurite resistance protein
LRALAGTPGRHLVTAAAVQVAMADGVVWPQEIALLNILRRSLGFDDQAPRDAASWEPGF